MLLKWGRGSTGLGICITAHLQSFKNTHSQVLPQNASDSAGLGWCPGICMGENRTITQAILISAWSGTHFFSPPQSYLGWGGVGKWQPHIPRESHLALHELQGPSRALFLHFRMLKHKSLEFLPLPKPLPCVCPRGLEQNLPKYIFTYSQSSPNASLSIQLPKKAFGEHKLYA